MTVSDAEAYFSSSAIFCHETIALETAIICSRETAEFHLHDFCRNHSIFVRTVHRRRPSLYNQTQAIVAQSIVVVVEWYPPFSGLWPAYTRSIDAPRLDHLESLTPCHATCLT